MSEKTIRPQTPKNKNNDQKNKLNTPLKQIIHGLQSNSSEEIAAACKKTRLLFDRKEDPSRQEFIAAEGITCLVKVLKSEDVTIQLEAVKTIADISSMAKGPTHALVKYNCIQPLIDLLTSTPSQVGEEALQALANIARKEHKLRNIILGHGIVDKLLPILRPLSPNTSSTFIRHIMCTIKHLCSYTNLPPNFEHIKPLLPTLSNLLIHKDAQLIEESCHALTYLTDVTYGKIQEVIDTGVVPRLVEVLKKYFPGHLNPALCVLVNIVEQKDPQKQVVINSGALNTLRNLLGHENLDIVTNSNKLISNIADGTAQQIQALIDANIIAPLIKNLSINDLECRTAAAWAITNFTYCSNAKQMIYLLKQGVIPAICSLLNVSDSTVILLLLYVINNILIVATSIGEKKKACQLVLVCGKLDVIKIMQEHENDEVSKVALDIIKKLESQ